MHTKRIFPLLFLCVCFLGCSPETEDLGNNYFLASAQNGGLELGKRMPGIPTYKEFTIIVESRILNYAFDSTFVIVKKAYKRSTIEHYFILNKHSDTLYGPLTIDSFMVKRKELRVPEHLKIE